MENKKPLKIYAIYVSAYIINGGRRLLKSELSVEVGNVDLSDAQDIAENMCWKLYPRTRGYHDHRFHASLASTEVERKFLDSQK